MERELTYAATGLPIAIPLFDQLVSTVAWRPDYERAEFDPAVDVPHLFRGPGCDLTVESPPYPRMVEICNRLNDIYAEELPQPFTQLWLCLLHRDGNDSTGWHGDRSLRDCNEDTLSASIGLGAARIFALRPRGGGASVRLLHGPGDLLVMGGSCQRTWQHTIPKTTKPCGPRISIQLRHPIPSAQVRKG